MNSKMKYHILILRRGNTALNYYTVTEEEKNILIELLSNLEDVISISCVEL